MPLETLLIRAVLLVPNLCLGTKFGPREEKPMRDVPDLVEELYAEVYEALGSAAIKQISDLILDEEAEMTTEQIWKAIAPETRELAERTVRRWADEHGGNESAALARFFGIRAICILSKDEKYGEDYKDMPSVSFGQPTAFAIAVWAHFKKKFPPIAKTRYIKEQRNADVILGQSRVAQIRNLFTGTNQGNKSGRKGG